MIEKLYGKNINFLIGSGASFDAIPTLATNYIENGKTLSIEEILESNKNDNENLKNLIYLYFYKKIIKTGFLEDNNSKVAPILKNYEKLLEELIKFMYRENYQKEKRINIFTTNYDLFFEKAADCLTGKYEFYFNDGSAGNINRKLSMKNYHKKIYHTGNFDSFNREIPIINLFKIHGSVSWQYDNEENPIVINVLYKENDNDFPVTLSPDKITNEVVDKILTTKEKTDIPNNIRTQLRNKFVLIFPEKDKFEKTLFQEYYYQFLRQFSYELERKNTILIVFGFSFADEHITEMIKRACNNPTLNIYIFCYNNSAKENIEQNLNFEKVPNNIKLIEPQDDEQINFDIFLKKLFTVESD